MAIKKNLNNNEKRKKKSNTNQTLNPRKEKVMNKATHQQTEQLKERTKALKLFGLLEQWDELKDADFEWITKLVQWEETQRHFRSLERRLSSAKLGRFKMLADFDWDWLKNSDRGAVEDLMTLDFLNDASNAILVGPNGVGKTTVAKNIAHTAVLHGKKVLFTTAAKMLNELAACDGDMALQRRLRYYSSPDVLCIDEVGYLSYSNRHADLLFEIINRRYENKSTLITTNRHHQPSFFRMGRSLPWCGLCCLTD
jgi:DNA replication protein DnaC